LTGCKPVSFSRRALHHGVRKGVEIFYNIDGIISSGLVEVLSLYVSDKRGTLTCNVTAGAENTAAVSLFNVRETVSSGKVWLR